MVRALDVSQKIDADLYLMAQEFQKSVSKGAATPEYEKSDKTKTKVEDIV